MKITREQLKGIVGEVLQEEQDYQQYFQAMLKKHGVKSPAQFKTDAEKKAFFDKVEAGWKGVSERIAQVRKENAEKVQQLREQEAQLKQEMETKKAELEELNNRITQAVETLEKLRPTQALSETEEELAKLNGEAAQTEEPQKAPIGEGKVRINEAKSFYLFLVGNQAVQGDPIPSVKAVTKAGMEDDDIQNVGDCFETKIDGYTVYTITSKKNSKDKWFVMTPYDKKLEDREYNYSIAKKAMKSPGKKISFQDLLKK